MITGKNYIGNDLSAKGKITFKTFNPKTNNQNEFIHTEASNDELEQAVNLASQAFKTYKNISGNRKSNFLNAIADEILDLGEALIQIYCSETGLPEGRAIGERGRTIFQLRSFAELIKEGSWVEATIDTAIPDREPIPKTDLRKMLSPLGPVVVFGASNFPLAYSTAGGDTAAALASGCPVIVKSHPMHAGTGELVASAIVKAAIKTGMPNGVFSNLNSSGIKVGVDLVNHPQVKAVGFTGSINAGRALFDLANQRKEPIPVFAEMGSVNPVILLPQAVNKRGEVLAKTYAGSITLGSGQFCTNPGLILGIKNDDLTAFINTLSDEIVKIEPTCMLHPNIIGNFEKNKKKAAEQKGVTVKAAYDSGVETNYGRQTILTVEGDTFLNNTALHHEVFGPFSLVVECENKEQLLEIVTRLEGQLTGTVLAEENELVENQEIIEALQNKVGRIIFNGVPTGVEVCPSMQHGGPYPASTDSRFTAVGVDSIKRWVRPISFQDWPNQMLPEELKNENSLHIIRTVNNKLTNNKI
ncbi:MAG: aldehyde dehydrogenase family protein [Flavobacteriaceae bacterium]|nr:aldehyde dehydrogenase family protein [Flavobacteriaceae bacterium]